RFHPNRRGPSATSRPTRPGARTTASPSGPWPSRGRTTPRTGSRGVHDHGAKTRTTLSDGAPTRRGGHAEVGWRAAFDKLAALVELVGDDAERLPVVAKLGEQLLHLVLALGDAAVGDLWRLRVLPADIIGEVGRSTIKIATCERFVALLERVAVGHRIPPTP